MISGVKMEERIEINGYSFDHQTGIEARKEQKAIEYLISQMDMNQIENVQKIYNQIITQKLFHTPVGYDFLKDLQGRLLQDPTVDNSQVPLIDIEAPKPPKAAPKEASTVKEPEDLGVVFRLRKRIKLLFIISIVLAAMVVAMFIITLTSRVPTILNYQQVLNDRYTRMEQELYERYQSGNSYPTVTDEE